jgi:hypothetical protein
MTARLYQKVGTRAEIFLVDNDASRAIETATKSDWYRSNHFAPYGNFYFREAHTLAQLTAPLTYENLSSKEKNELPTRITC